MVVGRKPLPTHLKVLHGNPGKKRLNKHEPRPRLVGPNCPVWLRLEAKREWRRMSAELKRLGLLTMIDRSALAAYCQAYARWREAEEKVIQEGDVIETPKGFIIQSPYVGMANRAMELILKILAEFGMTPSSRSRISVAPPREADPFEDYLHGRGNANR